MNKSKEIPIEFTTGTLAQRRKAFLDRIKNDYNLNNRCVGDDRICRYQATNNSPGCAIGRWLDEKLCRHLDRFEDSIVVNREVYSELPDWMRELGQDFLASCQSFHDDCSNWCENGVNGEGMEKYNFIVKEYEILG